jgi:hypothetical protein
MAGNSLFNGYLDGKIDWEFFPVVFPAGQLTSKMEPWNPKFPHFFGPKNRQPHRCERNINFEKLFPQIPQDYSTFLGDPKMDGTVG